MKHGDLRAYRVADATERQVFSLAVSTAHEGNGPLLLWIRGLIQDSADTKG